MYATDTLDDIATEHVITDDMTSAPPDTATERVINEQLLRTSDQLRIQVEFNGGMWWEMPMDLSSHLLQKLREGYEEVSFVWPWGNTRLGSYVDPDGKSTDFSRYKLNFRTMLQINTDNDRSRQIRILHIARGT